MNTCVFFFGINCIPLKRNGKSQGNTNTYHLYNGIPFIPKKKTQVFKHDCIRSVKFLYTFLLKLRLYPYIPTKPCQEGYCSYSMQVAHFLKRNNCKVSLHFYKICKGVKSIRNFKFSNFAISSHRHTVACNIMRQKQALQPHPETTGLARLNLT